MFNYYKIKTMKVKILTDRLNKYRKGDIVTFHEGSSNYAAIMNLVNNKEAEFVKEKEVSEKTTKKDTKTK